MDLSKYQDSSFDVVLCLGGVLSHVLKKGDRNKAIIELRRVCKRDGFLFISIIGRLAVLKQEIYYIGQNIKIIEEIKAPLFIKIAKTGDYDGSSGFTACHFFLADEFKQLLTDNGISVTNLIGLEGLNSFLWNESKFLKKDEKAWSNIMKVHELYESFPAAVDSSEHILAVCKNN
jgi:SAM-dependent methyltransferase